MKYLTIGKLAELTGISTDTLRYYEKMKLIAKAERSAAGYRLYNSEAVRIVRFIRGAKELSFSLDEIRQLLTLKTSDQSTCSQILDHTKIKIKEAENRIRELKEIKKVLTELVDKCPADNSKLDCCPILEYISREA